MKKLWLILFFLVCLSMVTVITSAQCSICTKTAQQLGEKPAKGLNSGIIYLAATPFLIVGYVFYRWKKSSHAE